MADSLVLSGRIELLGQDGGVPSTIPSCVGAIFRLGDGYDLGSAQPVADIIGSLVLDGERPFGRRASNRTIKLPVVIEVPASAGSADPRRTLAAAREVLLSAIDQQVWTLTWTRDGGSPLVLDCFRAQPTVVTYELASEISLVSELELSFQALPYGRADTQVQVAFAAPVPGTSPPPPPAPVVLDSFSSITGAQFGQSSQCIVGPFTAYWDPFLPPARQPDGAGTPLVYSAALPSPVNLTGLTALSLWVGLGAQAFYYPNLEWRGRTRCYVAFTLTDAAGRTMSFQSTRRLACSQNVYAPTWTYVTAPIPQGQAGFDYTRVAAYSVTITNRAGELRWVKAYLDALTAQPPSQAVGPASVRGTVYQLAGIQGTSHAPVSLTFQQPPTAGTPVTLTGTGTYTVPPGTVTLKVEATGGGGAGASLTGTGTGGGGGGGEYAREDAITVVPGQVIPYQCGIAGASGAAPVNGGDTTFGGGPGQTAVVAHGGQSAAQDSATGAAGGSGSQNSVAFPGGTGRTASGSVGGGGGSSGGSSSPGLTPTGTAATVFTTAGTSSWTCPQGVTAVLAECWGGGGGGGAASSAYYAAGAGAGGEYAAQTVPVTPGHTYSLTVGAAGTGGAANFSGNPGTAGGGTVFTGDAGISVTAHGGDGGGVNTFNHGGQGGQGGSGSTAATAWPGGDGGTGNPYGAGGGSSAGPSSPGNPGNGYGTPGAAVTGGGPGGAGVTGNGAGHAPSTGPGGGGGGSYNPGYAGGNGSAGQVRLTYPGGAPTNTGAPAVVGGGAGGNGGPSPNTAGSAGSAPGGGGGGADSGGSAEPGGAGGAGRIIVTPFSSAPFKTLIAHRPGPDAPPSLNPLVPVGNGADTPNGSTQYPVPSLVAGVNARFGGTYTVLLANFTWNNPTASRTVTVTVTQAEYAAGPSYVTSVSATVTPSTGITNGLVTVGELTLPYKDIAADNQGAVFTVSVTDTNTNDRFLDVILLDTTGQTVIINQPATGYVTLYADEPDPDRDLGRILGSQFGRPDAISVMDAATLSGGPLTVDPNASAGILLVYALEGAPAVAMSYFSRYWLDRV
jgi:hypothetical protein